MGSVRLAGRQASWAVLSPGRRETMGGFSAGETEWGSLLRGPWRLTA